MLLVKVVISPDYRFSFGPNAVLKVHSSTENAIILIILKFPQHKPLPLDSFLIHLNSIQSINIHILYNITQWTFVLQILLTIIFYHLKVRVLIVTIWIQHTVQSPVAHFVPSQSSQYTFQLRIRRSRLQIFALRPTMLNSSSSVPEQ